MQSCCQEFTFLLVFSLVFPSCFFTEMSRLRAGKKGDTHELNVITDRNGGWRAGGRRGFTESCCCPQAPEHFLHYTSASSLFYFSSVLPQVTTGNIKGISSSLTLTPSLFQSNAWTQMKYTTAFRPVPIVPQPWRHYVGGEQDALRVLR